MGPVCEGDRLSAAGEIFRHGAAVLRAQSRRDRPHHRAAALAAREGVELLHDIGRMLAVQIRHRGGISHHPHAAATHHAAHSTAAAHHAAAPIAAAAVAGNARWRAARRRVEDAAAGAGKWAILDGVGFHPLITVVARQLADLRGGDGVSRSRHDVRLARAAAERAQLLAEVIGLLAGKLGILRIAGGVAVGAVAAGAIGLDQLLTVQRRAARLGRRRRRRRLLRVR